MIAELTFPVRYVETDLMGVVHHSNYIIWFEAGRVEALRHVGLSYAEVERGGLFFAVAVVNARYLSPARFGDTVTVRTELTELRSRAVRFDYVIRDATNGCVLVEGYTRHIPIDRAGRVTRIPRVLIEALRPALRPQPVHTVNAEPPASSSSR